MARTTRSVLYGLMIMLLAGGCSGQGPLRVGGAGQTASAISHPFLLFGRAEIPSLGRRKQGDALLAECWGKLSRLAEAPDDLRNWARQLEARALVWQIEGDERMADRAIGLMRAALERTDPAEFYKTANFQRHAAPLRALALGWDWLYGRLTPVQRAEILPLLERWCEAAFNHTEQQWWREASYNCGSIPVAGIGLLALAIRADSAHPLTQTWYRETARRIGQNFFPVSWRPSGICWEGPNYAIVGLRYVAPFAEAVRRAGGDDLLGASGAARAMQYLMYQWMPWGGCAPIGDNTSYGRRTFAAEYLLGLGRTGDAAGLWTWRMHTDVRRLDPLITYLCYPLNVPPASPAEAGMPTSRYFEVTPNRAGYVFGRSRWDDPDAAFFSFVTRFEKCNHQHYDMNSFLLGGFGTLFATHESLYPYGNEHQGVDFEHNLVTVDGGGWPAHDKSNSCGDDNSTEGALVGLALGPFADYVRGDAKWSYRDNTILNSNPAIRAERACLFLKQGRTPYVLVVDDIQYRGAEHGYDWLWHAPDLPITGSGTPEDPLVIAAESGRCAIQFIHPARPAVAIEQVKQDGRRRPVTLKRITVSQRGVRVRYAALATLEKDAAARPVILPQAVECSSPSAGAVTVRFPDGSADHVAWQSEEDRVQAGAPLSAGPLATDGLMAMVRVKDGRVIGYVLGEGTYLRWGRTTLVSARDSVCVSAGPDGAKTFGRRRAREGLPPLKPIGLRVFKVTR